MEPPRSQNYRQAAADCMRTSARCKGITAKVFFQDLARRWRELAQEQEEFEDEHKLRSKPAASSAFAYHGQEPIRSRGAQAVRLI